MESERELVPELLQTDEAEQGVRQEGSVRERKPAMQQLAVEKLEHRAHEPLREHGVFGDEVSRRGDHGSLEPWRAPKRGLLSGPRLTKGLEHTAQLKRGPHQADGVEPGH